MLKPNNYLFFALIILVYILGAFLDVMDVDSAQYASMAKEMVENGNFLYLYDRGADYLDKPPLLFWVSAIFFQLFGYYNFVFRLPAILFSILGFYSTYRLGKLYYNEETGRISALILASSQAFFLMHHDLRTDTMLASAVIFAIWNIAEFNEKKRFLNLLMGFLGIGLAMLAKGPIGLMVPVLAFSFDFMLKRKWSYFFRWQWLVGLVITALVVLPFVLGLYWQFDLADPPKIINSEEEKSGVYFYFWKQSFGRLTGENSWNNDSGDPFFFVHTFLWSFLPWALLFIPAFFQSVWELLVRGFRFKDKKEEAITIMGFLLPFIALSFSKYKLPHYIYVIFPLAAIIAGKFYYKLIFNDNYKKKFNYYLFLQYFTNIILWALAMTLSIWAFPLNSIILWIIIGILLLLSLFFTFSRSRNKFNKIFYPSILTIVGVNFTLNTHLYPRLFKYQVSSKVAQYITKEKIPSKQVIFLSQEKEGQSPTRRYLHSFDFYSKTQVKEAFEVLDIQKFARKFENKCWVYTDSVGLNKLKQQKVKIKIIKKRPQFHISELNIQFLNPKTRHQETKDVYLLQIAF